VFRVRENLPCDLAAARRGKRWPPSKTGVSPVGKTEVQWGPEAQVTMVTVALVFIFFAILAVAYELHIITGRLIEIGTIVEFYNRRDLHASGILKDLDDSEDSDSDEHVQFDGESVTQEHKTWPQILLGILVASVVTLALIGFYGVLEASVSLH
jgi:hypothetical protein